MNIPLPLEEFLHRALSARYGIVVRTNNVEMLRQKLYAARRAAQNPDFEALAIAPSRANPTTELWIVRKPTDGKSQV